MLLWPVRRPHRRRPDRELPFPEQAARDRLKHAKAKIPPLVLEGMMAVETVAKHIADQCQQYTQYAGARPIGVALIIGGIDENGNSLFLTDPSGTYIPYNAVAIGADSDRVTEFLKKHYKPEMTLEESKMLAIASINMLSSDAKDSEHIKISQIKSDTKHYEIVDKNQITKLLQSATEKYPPEEK